MDQTVRIIQYTNEYGLKDDWTYKGNRLISTEFRYPKSITKKRKPMSLKQELFQQIEEQFEILKEGNNATTKSGQAKARKAASELKKLITPYKKANMDELKG